METVLSIKNLRVSFMNDTRTADAVRGVSLEVSRGEIVALVGESGCGKTVTAQSALRLNSTSLAKTEADVLQLGGVDMLRASEKELEKVRGSLAGMIFQDPNTCLNPTMMIGKQITEGLYRNKLMSAAECKAEAVRLLQMVGISVPELRIRQYPHQFSGGMRQRIMIAMALASRPALLIADEPTTALDATIQLQILQLISKIRKELGTAVLLITHDFGVVANLADRVCVMYAGKIVEEGTAAEVFQNPEHPYTKGLLKSLPLPKDRGKLASIKGTPPDLSAVHKGCMFAQRCSECMQICLREIPVSVKTSGRHVTSCWKCYEEQLKGTVEWRKR